MTTPLMDIVIIGQFFSLLYLSIIEAVFGKQWIDGGLQGNIMFLNIVLFGLLSGLMWCYKIAPNEIKDV